MEEWDKEKNVAVTGAVWKEDYKKFCPMSLVRPVTARLAPKW